MPSPASAAAPQRHDIAAVQILRAVAALAVVIAHLKPLHELVPWSRYGACGVDIFFVISGFIIVYASRDLFATPGGWRRFLCRRLCRVVPLYWLLITLHAALVLVPAGHPPPLTRILHSYFFLPFDGDYPIGDVGWTLDYEMLFYATFAAAIWLRPERAVLSIAVLFGGTAMLNRLHPGLPQLLHFWTDPIVCEFVFGAGIGLLYLRGFRLPPAASLALSAAGVAALLVQAKLGWFDVENMPRPLEWGIPALMLVTGGALSHRPLQSSGMTRFGVRLGDASYCIYLIHPLIMSLFPTPIGWLVTDIASGGAAVFGLPAPGAEALQTLAAVGDCVALVAIIIALSLASFARFERPLTRVLRRRFEPAQSGVAAMPQAAR
jgi:exopolysaccharide production protein ExoZ